MSKVETNSDMLRVYADAVDKERGYVTGLTIAMRLAADERDALAARVETLESVTEFMWTVVCNVSEGAWAKQNAEWQEAAARVRDQWHAYLASRPAGEETQG